MARPLGAHALHFPKFRDGRAYSQARLLRETYGFRGTLRATGDVLRDQFHFRVRAGFDLFEVKKPADARVFAKVVGRYSIYYQPGADGRAAALRRRSQSGAKTPKTCETVWSRHGRERLALAECKLVWWPRSIERGRYDSSRCSNRARHDGRSGRKKARR